MSEQINIINDKTIFITIRRQNILKKGIKNEIHIFRLEIIYQDLTITIQKKT